MAESRRGSGRKLEELAAAAEARGALKEAIRLREEWARFTADGAERAEILLGSAHLLARVDKDPAAARPLYERALEADPTLVEGWEALQRVGEATGDVALVARCLERRATLANPEDGAWLWLQLADVVGSRAGDRVRAAQAIDAAFAARPRSSVVAKAALLAYESAGRTSEALTAAYALLESALADDDGREAWIALRGIARLGPSMRDAPGAALRVRAAGLAAFTLTPYDPSVRKLLTASLRSTLDELGSTQGSNNAGTRTGDGALDDSSLRTLEAFTSRAALTLLSAEDADDEDLIAVARAFRNELADAASAEAALERVLVRSPSESGALVESILASGPAAVHFDALRRRPPDASVWRAIHQYFGAEQQWDRAFTALDVVATLGGGTPAERSALARRSPVPTGDVPGTLLPAAWRSHLLHPGLDPRLAALFRVLAPFLVPGSGPPPVPLPAAMGPDAARVAAIGNDAREILALSTPLFLRIDPHAEKAITTAARDGVYLLLPPAVVERARPEELAYLAGRAAAFGLGELVPRTLAASPVDLDELLALLARVVGVTKPFEVPGVRSGRWPTVSHLASLLTSDVKAGISDVLRPLETMELAAGATRAYWDFADASASRAGLLLSGSLGIATRGELLAARAATPLDAERWFTELAIFAVSRPYAELREALGIAHSTPI